MNSKAIIQEWFFEHDGDGEFSSCLQANPYSVIGSRNNDCGIILTTKPTPVSLILHESEVLKNFGMIGRYGLPCEEDLLWIRKVIDEHPVFFLGDMDPVDLMVFAWMRDCLSCKHFSYLGINDKLIQSLDVSSTQSLCIPHSPSEQKSLVLLRKAMPDLTETVGENCAKMLDQGYKIELDMIMSQGNKIASAFNKLLPSTHSHEEDR